MLRRAAPDKLPSFRLTPRDRQIILAVYEHRALTAPQIAALFFPSSKHNGAVNARCKHRLRLLYHYGYLFRDEQPQKMSEGRKHLVYFLDERAAEFLSEQLGTQALDWTPKDNDVSYPFLEHLLATNQVRVAIEVSAMKHGWVIEQWLDDKQLKSPGMKDTVTLRGPEGGKRQAAVVPDGYFRLSTSEDRYNFLVEADLGNITVDAASWLSRDWSRKVRAYLEYHRSGTYQKRYHTSDMRILTITTSEKRLANLKRITEKAGGKARFWFTTFERIKHEDVLTAPIWQVASRQGLYPLLQP